MAAIVAGLYEIGAYVASAIGELAFGTAAMEVASGAELTPLLAQQAVQGVVPFLPAATATAIGTAEIGAGLTGADIATGINIGSTIYNLEQASGHKFLESDIATLQKGENQGDPNAARAKAFLDRTGVDITKLDKRLKPVSTPYIPVNPNDQNTVLNITPPTNLFNQGITKLSSTITDYNTKNRGNEISINKSGTILDPYRVGQDLGRFVGLTENELSKGNNEVDAYKNVSMTFPELAYLIANITGFRSYTPNPNTLAKVREYMKTYTGKNMSPETTFIDELGNVGGINEFGNREVYTGTRGNAPAYDTFCGPNSPNNKRPTTYFGTYCMFHDIGYDKNGFFDLESDLRFVARIYNNLNKMGYSERVLAMTAAHYFLTTGNSFAMFKNILPSNVDEKAVTTPAKDISAHIFGLQLPPLQRQRFYKGVRNGAESTLALQAAPSKYVSSTLLPMFDQIEILEAFDWSWDQPEVPVFNAEVPPIDVVPVTPQEDVPLEDVPDIVQNELSGNEVVTQQVQEVIENNTEMEYETPIAAVA